MLVRPSSRIGSFATTPIRIGSKLYIADIEPSLLAWLQRATGADWLSPPQNLPPFRAKNSRNTSPVFCCTSPDGCYRWHRGTDYLERTVSGKVTLSYSL